MAAVPLRPRLLPQLEYWPVQDATEIESRATRAELDTLLAAVASGRVCRVRGALRPHFSQPDLMAAMAGGLLSNHPRVASLLLRHTHELPTLEVGQNGSLPDLDGVVAATLRCFVKDGGLTGAGGWGSWGGHLLYDALEMGQHKTAAALLGSGAQLPTPVPLHRQDEEAAVQGRQQGQQRQQETQQRQQEGQPAQQAGQSGHQTAQQRQQEKQQGQQGRSSLHVLAESTFAWGRPEVAQLAWRLTRLGASLTSLDSQGRTPLLAACQQRLQQGRLHGRAGLDLILALSTPESTCVGSPMQLAAGRGDSQAVTRMARGGGTDSAAIQAALPLAAAQLRGDDVAALRLCGAAVPAELAAELAQHERLRGALLLDTAGLLMRFRCTFHLSALLRTLGASPVTAAALAAASPHWQAAGKEVADEARLASARTAAVVRQQVRPFLLCMHRLQRGQSVPRQRTPPLHDLPGSAVDLVCVLLLLHSHIL